MPDIRNIAPSKNWFDGRTFLAQARELMERKVDPDDLWKRPAQLEVAILSIWRGIWTLYGRHPEDGSVRINEFAGEHLKGMELPKRDFEFEIESWWYHFKIKPLRPGHEQLSDEDRLRLATLERSAYADKAMAFAMVLFRTVYTEAFEVPFTSFRGDNHDRHFWEWEEADARLGLIWTSV